jgi:hypothetical protein
MAHGLVLNNNILYSIKKIDLLAGQMQAFQALKDLIIVEQEEN